MEHPIGQKIADCETVRTLSLSVQPAPYPHLRREGLRRVYKQRFDAQLCAGPASVNNAQYFTSLIFYCVLVYARVAGCETQPRTGHKRIGCNRRDAPTSCRSRLRTRTVLSFCSVLFCPRYVRGKWQHGPRLVIGGGSSRRICAPAWFGPPRMLPGNNLRRKSV